MTTTGISGQRARDLGEDLEPGAVGEHQVEEEEVDRLLREALEPLGRRRRPRASRSRPSRGRSEHLADDGFVVEDQDRHGVRSRRAARP